MFNFIAKWCQQKVSGSKTLFENDHSLYMSHELNCIFREIKVKEFNENLFIPMKWQEKRNCNIIFQHDKNAKLWTLQKKEKNYPINGKEPIGKFKRKKRSESWTSLGKLRVTSKGIRDELYFSFGKLTFPVDFASIHHNFSSQTHNQDDDPSEVLQQH